MSKINFVKVALLAATIMSGSAIAPALAHDGGSDGGSTVIMIPQPKKGGATGWTYDSATGVTRSVVSNPRSGVDIVEYGVDGRELTHGRKPPKAKPAPKAKRPILVNDKPVGGGYHVATYFDPSNRTVTNVTIDGDGNRVGSTVFTGDAAERVLDQAITDSNRVTTIIR
ncbi:hypothetical protein [Terrarubrum flagellatum]|uniref:hypothetical protein n=1 Tax=Terrirubrum flagellatum TaxID=2895980 RepID=UPI0031456AB8